MTLVLSGSMAAKVLHLLRPALDACGYGPTKSSVLRGKPFRVVASGSSILGDGCEELAPIVEVYENNAYPNSRDEVFLNVWNAIGSSYKDQALASAIRKIGFECRVTRFKGSNGIAVKISWEDLR